MLTHTEWQKIKAELKKNIEPVFTKAGIALSMPFEELVDIFQGVLDKDDVDSSVNGRDDIEILLKMVYVDGNIKLAGSTLDVLSGKLEGYLKKVFKISNQPLFQQGDGMLAHHIKTIFRKKTLCFSRKNWLAITIWKNCLHTEISISSVSCTTFTHVS